MKILIKWIFLLSVSAASICSSQSRDSLIQLYPGMDDTIRFTDRTYFGLFNQIDGYEYSTVYININKKLISKITFLENGILRDTILINDLSVLQNTRLKMEEIENEFDKKIKSLREVDVTMKNKREFGGTLKGISKNYLFLQSSYNYLTNHESKFNYRIPLSEVDRVLIKGESNYLSPVLWGAGIGFATGILAPIGFSVIFQESIDSDSEPEVEFSSELLPAGLICAVLGAGIGYIIGWLTSENDLPIKFASDRSVLRLKDYAHYNFRDLKKINEEYQEIK